MRSLNQSSWRVVDNLHDDSDGIETSFFIVFPEQTGVPGVLDNSCNCVCPGGNVECPYRCGNGLCLEASRWCDGIQDCDIDEVNCNGRSGESVNRFTLLPHLQLQVDDRGRYGTAAGEWTFPSETFISCTLHSPSQISNRHRCHPSTKSRVSSTLITFAERRIFSHSHLPNR